jgi:hypothetical protein
MSPPVLPFDVISLIIDIVGENKDTYLLKELALVSHSFLQICSKHIFATVDLHDAYTINPKRPIASSKKGFIELLKSRPDVVKYIRKLTYKIGHKFNIDDDHLLSLILSNFLHSFSLLNCLTITAAMATYQDWNRMDSSLTSALLHLMHLPTINHIDLLHIKNFPLSSLSSSVNLLQFDILHLNYPYGLEENKIPEVVVQSMPRICEFHTLRSALPTKKLLHAKRQDGQLAFNFTDLRRLSICFGDEQNIRYLLRNANLLEELHLSVRYGQEFVRLRDVLYSSARTLKVLGLSVDNDDGLIHLLFAGFCEDLEAMAGHNILEALSFEAIVEDECDTEDSIGSVLQNVEKVLVKPGWSALRQVSFKFEILGNDSGSNLYEPLQSLPDKYLSHLSKLESVAFNYSAYLRIWA